MDVIAGNWDTHVRTKRRLGGCGAKEGDAEEIRFGTKWMGMVRCHLPNPFCCFREINGENKRMSKIRVKLWRRSWGREKRVNHSGYPSMVINVNNIK